jgi:RecA-family ATPase
VTFPRAIPASELRAIVGEEADWIVRGYLGRDVITLLSALWKAGKTTWLAHLLQALGRGEFCGLECRPIHVLYITEESETLWASRRDGIGIGDNVRFLIRPFKFRPAPGDWLKLREYLEVCLREADADLIIIDTLSGVWPVKDENDAAQVQEALMPLRTLGQGRAILIVHHLGKAGGH